MKFVGYDDFWNAFIVQIRVNGADPQTEGEPQVEIVPRAGDQVIALGGIDAYEQKLDKLMSFYRKAVLYEGWDRYRYVNLKYKESDCLRQVIRKTEWKTEITSVAIDLGTNTVVTVVGHEG